MDNELTNDTIAVIDIDGQERHKWSKAQLQALYNDLSAFRADCTIEEEKRFRTSLIDVMSFILQKSQVTLFNLNYLNKLGIFQIKVLICKVNEKKAYEEYQRKGRRKSTLY